MFVRPMADNVLIPTALAAVTSNIQFGRVALIGYTADVERDNT